VQCVITGFDAFDTADVNPTQRAVELLDRDLLDHLGVPGTVGYVKHTLATCCSEAWFAMDRLVKSLPADEPFAIVMTGVAANRSRICLERFALNVRSYRVSDNRGHQWQEEYIDEKAPDALRSNLPLFELRAHLNDLGLLSDISNYAGSFVCNETYFRCLQKWRNDPRCKGIIFLHFPNLLDYVGTNAEERVPIEANEFERITEAALSEYTRAIAEVVKFINVRATSDTLVAGA